MLFDLYIPKFYVKFFYLFYFKFSGDKNRNHRRNGLYYPAILIQSAILTQSIFFTIRNGKAVDFIIMSVFML